VTIEAGLPWVLALLLGSVRAATWLLVSPPFATRAIPTTVKVIVSLALALPVTPKLAADLPELTVPALIGAVALQALAGAALGFLTYLLFAAVQAAGDLIDLFGGFSIAAGYDPLSMSQTSIFGRFHQLLAVVLLLTTNAHLLVVQGFLTSYEALPATQGVALDRVETVLLAGVGQFFLAALEIAGPLVAVLFLADVALGLLTRVSPQLNAFSLGFPIKIFTTLALVGFTFPLLPGAVESIADAGTRAMLAVLGGEPG
jgi:flagellar biosynthesis protein FliR